MGDDIDDALAGDDGTAVQSSNTVDASDNILSPSFTSSSTAAPPVTIMGSSSGTPPASSSIWTQLASAVFGPAKPTTGMTAAQLAALKAQSGPSTTLLLGGLVVGAIILGVVMHGRSQQS